jgi:capsular polysaccharide transport system ATP-binding protein
VIALFDAGYAARSKAGPTEVLRPTSCIFGDGERIGILAARGSGKSSIARLLAGIAKPTTGKITRSGRISWPIGATGFIHPDLTVTENVQMIARLLGEDPHEMLAACEDLTRLGVRLQDKVKTLSPLHRAALGYTLSLAVDCDTYIADDVAGFGTGALREQTELRLHMRLARAGLVFLSSNPRQIAKFCDQNYVLIGGRLLPCNDLEAGQAALDEMGGDESVESSGLVDD